MTPTGTTRWLHIIGDKREPVEAAIREDSSGGQTAWTLAIGGTSQTTTHGSAKDAFDALIQWAFANSNPNLSVRWDFETGEGLAAFGLLQAVFRLIAEQASGYVIEAPSPSETEFLS